MAFLKRIFQSGADLVTSPLRSESSFLSACAEGDENILERQLTYNIDVNCSNNQGQTGVILAVVGGHLAVYKRLIECGARVEMADTEGNTALHLAMQKADIEMCSLLLEHGAPVNAQNSEGYTALHCYIQQQTPPYNGGDDDIMELFHQHDADITTKNNTGYTLLHTAAHTGIIPICSWLIEHGLSVHVGTASDDTYTALHEAVEQRYTGLCDWLLNNGADVHGRTQAGLTALHYALRVKKGSRGRPFEQAVCDVLLEHGADINAKDSSGRCALQRTEDDKIEAAFTWLLDKGADIRLLQTSQTLDIEGYPTKALRYYAKKGKAQICDLLIKKHGARVDDGLDEEGFSMLQRAVANNMKDICECLLNHGADVEVEAHPTLEKTVRKKSVLFSNHMRPLHLAAIKGYSSIVWLLLQYRAEVDAVDSVGFTPLAYAAESGNKETCTNYTT